MNRTMSADLTLLDIFNAKERNLPWEKFRLQAPKKYQQGLNKQAIPSGAIFGKKDHYLDHLLKKKRLIPGPRACSIDLIKEHTKTIKINKSNRVTFSDQIKRQCAKENLPGPGTYNSFQTKPKTSEAKREPIEPKQRQHYLTEVQYLAEAVPGVGQYNITRSKTSSIVKMVKERSKSLKPPQNIKLIDINPLRSCSGTFASICKSKKNSNIFGSSKRFSNGIKEAKAPCCNTYKLNNKWTDKENVLRIATTSNYNKSKSVYYN